MTSIRPFLVPPSHLLPFPKLLSDLRHRDRAVAYKEAGKRSAHFRRPMYYLSSSRGDYWRQVWPPYRTCSLTRDWSMATDRRRHHDASLQFNRSGRKTLLVTRRGTYLNHLNGPDQTTQNTDESSTFAITSGTRPHGGPMSSRVLLTSGDHQHLYSCTELGSAECAERKISSVPSLLSIGFDEKACRATPAPNQSEWHNVDSSPRPANLVPAMCLLYASKSALALPLATLERHAVPYLRNRALPPTTVHTSGSLSLLAMLEAV
ncbi:hypothetical protein CERZMDRAFT_97382 [Cercospora zeae-maydis SCOH1-5]|uniref:Uncharacterized protein n=1 Tax=Cercospora zeae-maydis SCOH1-5 TaxID=717836 RepID=A0A6A6FHD3_9PEZI|nr:hypothetical protein CERZMDRAFT_97382 [Cercospora zeae-maydis SCOH1-5]